MIIVNLKGGIGNQLFQYATGRHLALRNKTELKLDISGLDRANKVGDIYRPFDLDSFTINATIANDGEVIKLKYPYGLISKAWRWFTFKILRKKNLIFDQNVLSWSDNIYLDGYWQSPKYFDDIRETLLNEIVFNKTLSASAHDYLKKIETNNSIALHVRRGDYIKNPTVLKEFGVCSNDYYTEALAYISDNVINPTFFVFSDDIEWVKANIQLPNSTIFVKGKDMTAVEDLVLMSKCRHNIIANSSFSWWSAWLNNHPDKIVIAPTPWFDTIVYDKDLIPKSWIQIQK
jgi:hypothetical protein